MKVVLLEPFYTGSHRTWANQLRHHSWHQITVLSMTGRYWKWRMHGAAVTLAQQFRQIPEKPDLILATDMMDLSSFLALTRDITAGIPTAIYFHENQLAYPWSNQVIRSNNWRHFAFINYVSALSADWVLFNSSYNLKSFREESYQLLKTYPDHQETETLNTIHAKSSVLSLGMNLKAFDPYLSTTRADARPLLLWNHRWEYDKNPEAFAKLVETLFQEGYDFEVAILGEAPYGSVEAFEQLRTDWGTNIVAFGFAESFEAYASWLSRADVVPVTADQDFFGGSVVEAIYCGCYPIMPNRLVYPGHVPFGREYVLYDTFEELLQKTRLALASVSLLRQQDFREWVTGYDWEVLIAEYDQTFSAISDGAKA